MKGMRTRGRTGLRGNNTGVPAGSKRERAAYERGPLAMRSIRLKPGQRPHAVYATPAELETAERLSRRMSYYDRGGVTADDFKVLKRRFRTWQYTTRNAYFAHPRIRKDIREWAEASLCHVPHPDNGVGAGLLACDAAESLEKWLNARRWPVSITAIRMGLFLREMGFGTNNGRWNCGFRTLEAEGGTDDKAGTGKGITPAGP